MAAVAEPLTPARFDVLTRQTGRHPIEFSPAAQKKAIRLAKERGVAMGIKQTGVALAGPGDRRR